MLRALLDALFGCRHKRVSLPITMPQQRRRTYVVCLECGAELPYDWNAMKLVRKEK